MTNKLPGLRPMDDRPSVGGRNNGRARTPEANLGERMLQPQARPVDTYSRPQQPNSGPNGLQQLVGALATINPKLGQMAEEDEKRAQQDAQDRASKRIGGMTFEEAKAAVDRGDMTELQDPWFRATYMRQYGERLAYQRMNELSASYAQSPDRETMNMDQFVAKQMREDLDAYGSDKHFTKSYTQLMSNYSQKAGAAHAQYQSEQAVGEAKQGVYETFLGRARLMAGEGKSPQEIAQALRGDYDGHKNLLGISFKEQDAEMVRVAEAFANEGNVDMAKAILHGERVGADGTKLGRLADNREFSQDANRILNTANSKLEANNGEAALDARMEFNEQARGGKLAQADLMAYHQANPGAFSDAQVISLINQSAGVQAQEAEQAAKSEQTLQLRANARTSENTLLQHNMDAAAQGRLPFIEEGTVLTDTGDTKKVSVEDQKKAVAAAIVSEGDWLAEKKQATPEQVFARNVEAFTVNDLVNPKWEQVLAAAPVGATQFTNSGGEMPAQLKEGVELYMRLHNANPKLLENHIKDAGDRDFYEAFRMATQYAGAAPEQALQTATAMTSDPSKFQTTAVQQRFDEIDQRVKSVKFGGDWYWAYQNKSAPNNIGYVANEIGRLGKFYAQNGLGTDKALDEAKARFQATHTEVNGNYIYTAGKDVPKNFGELAGYALQKYADDFGAAEGGKEASDLTIRPATNGNGWLIVDALTQLPVENSARANLTLRSMGIMDEERRIAKKDAVIQQSITRQDAFSARELEMARRWVEVPDYYDNYVQLYGEQLAQERKRKALDIIEHNKR